MSSEAEVAGAAAEIIASKAQTARTPVVGLATGSSPLGVYRELAAMIAAGTLDLSHASAFALDEYVGIGDRPQSYRRMIDDVAVGMLGLSPRAVHVPDGEADDLDAACRRYDAAIAAAGGVDVQLLGIGSNGHIAFNEPGSDPQSRTRVVTLEQTTRDDNARFFASVDEVPRRAVTQGIGTIMAARSIVLVALGAAKAEAVAAATQGVETARVPASVLQRHADATIVADVEAARLLRGERGHRIVTAPAA